MKEDKNINPKTHQNPKGTKSLIAILLIVATLSLSLGMYAWAKYSRSEGGTASANVAKWHFELKKGTVTGGGKEYLALTRTDNYGHVVSGEVAPGTFGEIPIVIDSTGTEVDMVYDLLVRIENCPENMVFTTSDASATTETRSR